MLEHSYSTCDDSGFSAILEIAQSINLVDNRQNKAGDGVLMRSNPIKTGKLLLIFLLVLLPFQVYGQNYPDPTRYEETIQRFEAEDKASPPPEGAILLTGSSSIARWNNQAKSIVRRYPQ